MIIYSKEAALFNCSTQHSHDNIFSENIISNNGGWGGIYVKRSYNNRFTKNIISDNNGYGMLLKEIPCYNNRITENIFENNTEYGIIINTEGNNNNVIYHNSFINNPCNVYDISTNIYDNGYPIGGNYWSDFDEASEGAWDNNSDGIVDSPYNIPGGGNQDRYPLIHPWGWIPPPSIVYVDDDFNDTTPGWGVTNFSSIQDGINAVVPSGNVYVSNGSYYENVVINKKINLIGEDRNGTIIDGGGSGNVVYITADGVNISGFTMVKTD